MAEDGGNFSLEQKAGVAVSHSKQAQDEPPSYLIMHGPDNTLLLYHSSSHFRPTPAEHIDVLDSSAYRRMGNCNVYAGRGT